MDTMPDLISDTDSDDSDVELDDLFVSDLFVDSDVSPDRRADELFSATADFNEPPPDNWCPSVSVAAWAAQIEKQFPAGLRRWIDEFEPSMKFGWRYMIARQCEMLPVLSVFALAFPPAERLPAVKLLWQGKGFSGSELQCLDELYLGFPADFGLAEFRHDDDVSELRYVLATADRFVSLLDSRGFPKCFVWDPLPRVVDPENFKAGGVHQPDAVRNWWSLPEVSKWVKHWVRDRVWFSKLVPHRDDHSAKNAQCFDRGSSEFDEEKFAFMEAKIKEMVRIGAVVTTDPTHPPSVLTRLSLAPKPGGGKDIYRVIMDMRPENSCYRSRRVKMETLSQFSSVFSPAAPWFFSLDLKSAYWSVGVAERTSQTMGFKWAGCFYRFCVLPFGWKCSSFCFVKLGRQVLKKWRAMGPGDWESRFAQVPELSGGCRAMVYIDDSAGSNSRFVPAIWQRNAMALELEALGFSLAAKGELLPFQSLTFLGLQAHFASPMPSWHVPAHKLESLKSVAEDILLTTDRHLGVPLRQAAKCVGKMISVMRAVPVAQLMSRDLARVIFAKGSPDWSSRALISPAARRELVWILRSMDLWNARGSPIFARSTVVDLVLALDAGPRAAGFHLASSVQGVLATDVAEKPSADTLQAGTIDLTDDEAQWPHVHKELLAVHLALRAGQHKLFNRRVQVLVDSTTTVYYLTKYGGRSEALTAMVKQIWYFCLRNRVRVEGVRHISGKAMVLLGVDALSRPVQFRRGKEADRADWRLHAKRFDFLCAAVGVRFSIDRMATRANTRCKRFNTCSPHDPDAVQKCNTFANDWDKGSVGQRELNYCFPPFELVPRVLQHVRECGAWACIVVPRWPSQHWWVELMSMTLHVVEFPPHSPSFERIVDGQWQTVEQSSFRAMAVVVDGRMGQPAHQ